MSAKPLTAVEIQNAIRRYLSAGLSVFASSSFQTHSIPLLHIISETDSSIPIAFLNTGFLFPETISYRDQIVRRLGLNLIELRSTTPKLYQLNSSGNFFYTSDPDRCCLINKIEPMQPLLMQHDIWISGVRSDQNENRSKLEVESTAGFGCKRYHPMLGWTAKTIYEYRIAHDLPEHPLEKEGYFSIGCEPCTRKFDAESGRDGRWQGLNKTECGLHTEFVREERKSL